MYVEYNSNNSGGHWWLTDDDWKALEKAGWIVEWASLEPLYGAKGRYQRTEGGLPKLVPVGQGNSELNRSFVDKDKDGKYRYLGALAKRAYRLDLSLREAVKEWERATGQCSTDAGCACCGAPHHFVEYDDEGKYVKSGPDTEYVASWGDD